MLSYNRKRVQSLYEVEFYYDKSEKSQIVDFLDELQAKSKTSKADRINREKILAYIGALARFGTRIGKPYVKHIDGEIWELRPLGNRIFFFYWKDNKFVLLHHFIKKTQKTPPKEIAKAKSNLKDFMERNDNV